jgi:hypothetical protein
MIEDNLLKIVKKFLIGNTFDVNGFKYRFLSVEHLEFFSKGTFKFTVNVDTPMDGQSYVVAKFDLDIERILINLWKYFGMQFSYSIEKILVNGKPKNNNDVYISEEKQKELITTLNREIPKFGKTVQWINSERPSKLTCNVSFRPEKAYFYSLEDVNIEFYFDLHLSNFQENGKPIYPNMDKIDDLGAAMTEIFRDNDNFKNICDEIIYNVLEPEMRIGDVDELYYNSSYMVTKIDGMDTSRNSWGVFLDRSQFT